MTDEELRQERRKQNRFEKLGTNEPRCGTCGEDRWQCLELHEPAGRAYDSSSVIVCGNCHRVLSDDQIDHPRASEPIAPALFAIGRFLLGLADMLRAIVEKLIAFGKELTERAACPAEPDR